jgi:predicted transcriptional regulator
VKDAFNPDPQVIREGETVAELLEHLGPGTQMHFPVVDEDARVVGMISVTELGTIAKERAWLAPVLLAADVAVPLDPVGPEETLLEVTRKMGARGISTLPVADPATGRLLGVIDRGHVLAVYERRVAGEPETVA